MRAGVRHFFYQSALGSDKTSWSGYLKTKAEAEEIVMQSGIPFTIFRPSLIIGPWDGFTRKMVDLIRLSPVIPYQATASPFPTDIYQRLGEVPGERTRGAAGLCLFL